MPEFKVRFVASNDATRALGLMHQEPLADNEVAFFIFPHSERYAFWNKNVSFPITLAFVNEHGIVVDIGHLDAEQQQGIRSGADARFVVEAARGALEGLGLKKGDIVTCDGKTLKVTTVHETKQNTGRPRLAQGE